MAKRNNIDQFMVRQNIYTRITIVIAVIGFIFYLLLQVLPFETISRVFNSDNRSEAAGKKSSDIQIFRGQTSVTTSAWEQFTTFSNETSVIVSLQAANGGMKSVTIYDPMGNNVGYFYVPSGVKSLWSTQISNLLPSTTYKVEIKIDSSSSKYTLYINHCPDNICF